jgi:hypothetical protein
VEALTAAGGSRGVAVQTAVLFLLLALAGLRAAS